MHVVSETTTGRKIRGEHLERVGDGRDVVLAFLLTESSGSQDRKIPLRASSPDRSWPSPWTNMTRHATHVTHLSRSRIKRALYHYGYAQWADAHTMYVFSAPRLVPFATAGTSISNRLLHQNIGLALRYAT